MVPRGEDPVSVHLQEDGKTELTHEEITRKLLRKA